ncbi:hypothetical protein CBER1_10067 [Cercospora berteroae]|uniref:Uncharacterized protein n=1 Tax=Cercospora berteroae TaxID=357750 RepID=A0A2S6C6K7_9PEZI|nr:hypothetical protein CBER1_10067 [Cercospora berteroae]
MFCLSVYTRNYEGLRDAGRVFDISRERHPDLPGGEVPLKPWYRNSTFEQLIDHKNPHVGTFDQVYFYDTTYWKGPDSPVVFFTPGELNATNIKDVTRFAREVQLPFAPQGGSNAQDVPWVMMGASYSGALTAAIARVDPGTFGAYAASSAPVQAVSDFWSYYVPIQKGMPQNCSKDVSLVIEHMDGVLMHGSTGEQRSLKTRFGMQDVEHNDDFMAALALGPWSWQDTQFYNDTGFWKWCDYIENAVNATARNISIPGAEGVGLEKALDGYAAWWKDVKLPDFCASTYQYAEFNTTNNTRCYDTYNASSPLFTDISLANQVNRQWIWMTCNEPFGYWPNGSPPGRPTLVTRLITTGYALRQCGLWFPPGPNGETYGLAAGRTEADVNAYTGGWSNINTSRLVFINGEFDPWREASVSADAEFRPGGPLQSTPQVPVEIVPGGFHGSDMRIRNGVVKERVKEVQERIVKQLEDWVKEWPKKTKDHHT